MAKEENKYDESSIVSLGYVEGVRFRPSTFIDKLGKDGVMKMAMEMIQNSNDEISNGYGTGYKVKIKSDIPEITVTDNGRGIPIGAVETILENIYSGGKYNQSNYKVSSGQNGIGTSLLNILSEYMILEIHRDGKIGKFRYEKGYQKSKDIQSEPNQNSTGTSITIKPDLSIFFGPNSGYVDDGKYLNKTEFLFMINNLSLNNPGILIEVEYDKENYKFQFTSTLEEYLLHTAKKEGSKLLSSKACTFEDIETPPVQGKNFSIKACVAFAKEGSKIYSFMNNFPTVEHGKHVDGIRAGVSRVITQYIKDNGYIPKGSKFSVTGGDIIDNIICIVMGKMSNPLYDGQTKNKLTSEDFFNYCSTQAYKYYSVWASKNKEEMDKICKTAVLKAKAKFAAKEARDQALKQDTSVKNILSSKLNFKNFTDCSSNNPKERELFLCEGLSASSALVMSRDSKTQAYLALRGKVLNITGETNPKLSEELLALNAIMGLKFKSDGSVDLDKLRYSKIIILTDSDTDGGHISVLLMTYFYLYCKEIICNGMVYIANPPFYSFVYNNKGLRLNVLNESYFTRYKKEIALIALELIDSNNKKLSNKIFSVFLDKIIGFDTFMSVYSTELNLTNELLELIIRSFDHLLKGKYKQFEYFGYKVTCVNKNKTSRLYHFDREFNHYYLKIDNLFYEKIYKPIYSRLCDIKLSTIKLRNKKTGEIYSGTLCDISKSIDLLLIGKKTIVQRFKGLAECSSELLRETALDPKTRKIIQVKVEDVDKTTYWTNVLMGTLDMNVKKNFFSK